MSKEEIKVINLIANCYIDTGADGERAISIYKKLLNNVEKNYLDKQYLSDEDIAAIKSCYDDTSLTAEERIENGDAALFSRLTKGMELTDNAEGEALIEKYKAIDAYSSSPIMKQEDFEHLQDVIIAAGVMDARVAFADVVDNSLAQAVLDGMA